ncbi:MAG: hypothetical protein FJ271_04105 [Planctomycetes bacterium]|nr:hypothetical protein [Planctomycetota bacterium]
MRSKLTLPHWLCRRALLLGGLLFVASDRARAQGGLFGVTDEREPTVWSATGLRIKLNGFEPPGEPPADPAPGQVIASPTLGWSGQLGTVAAVQGFVGQSLGIEPRLTDDFRAGTHYGLVVQCPIQAVCEPTSQKVMLFFQARGGFRFLEEQGSHVPTWRILPGIEWRFRENVRMRVSGNADDLISCWWRY